MSNEILGAVNFESSLLYSIGKWFERDVEGNTLLHHLAMNDDVQMLSAIYLLRLVDCQVSYTLANTLKNKDGKTPLDLAKSEHAIQLLQKGQYQYQL